MNPKYLLVLRMWNNCQPTRVIARATGLTPEQVLDIIELFA